LPAGTKAILPVHLYGQAADMDNVLELAREKGLLVVEDAAQAHGAVHARGRCGTLGRAGAFSFYPGKNLGAYGDGGAVCTNDDALAEKLRLLRNWGSTEKYIHRVQGFNSRLDTLQAAVLGVKLRHLAEGNRKRRQIAGWYNEALAPLAQEVELPREAPWSVEHVYHLFVIKLRSADRDTVQKRLVAEGIGAGIHYPVPIHLQEAYANLGLGPGSFPVSEDAARRILSLPLFPELSREQVGVVAGVLRQALGR
jgi:dTDP-4-amino-4,6-dideoxygalactose transaminase